MNTLEHYVAASAVARKLRDFSDNDLAWIAWLSPPNMALVCERFETTENILRLAQVYEMARRQAFPSSAGRRDGREEHPCAALSSASPFDRPSLGAGRC